MKLRFGGGCTRAAGVGSPDERGEEPCKARSHEDAPRVKQAPVWTAIYTSESVEGAEDKQFNSIDAQRQMCESFIAF